MIIENTNFLRNKFRNIYDTFNNYEPKEYSNKIEVVKSVSGTPTLLLKNDSETMSIHSRYNPEDEAEVILKEYANVMRNYKHISFTGVGLGYIVEAFKKLYPDKEFSIYEPIEDIFEKYINLYAIENKNLTNLCVGQDEDKISAFLDNVLKETEKGLFFLYLPSYKRLFSEECNKFSKILNLAVKRRRSSLATNLGFQKEWTTNSVYNFKFTLDTPDVFAENPDRFKGKTGIIVSAGPSLDFELENLKYIKQNNMAFIFSVGTGTNVLLINGIKPHAALTYDPSQGNMLKVFKEIISYGYDDIPLIYGTSVYRDIPEAYKGPMVHMITGQDSISDYYLQNEKGEKFERVQDAPSIAVLGLELFIKLGCSKIILVGQNLAYYKGQNYGKSIKRDSKINLNSPSIIKVEDVYGNQVETSMGYISAREQMENYIKLFENTQVINTTKYGAKIKGTIFKELDKVIEEDLQKDDIDVNFYDFKNTKLDIQYLKNKQDTMNKHYKQLNNILKAIENNLSKMITIVRNNNFKQLEHSYNVLDELYSNLSKNDFFNVFIYPMIRTNWQYFCDKINEASVQTNQLTRADIIINEYRRFIFVCRKEIKENAKSLFDRVNTTIDDYMSKQEK